jgi:hypothetical protein
LLEGPPLLEEAEARRAALFEKLLLLGTDKTTAAAREWHVAVWELQRIFRGNNREGGDKFSLKEKDLFSIKISRDRRP